MDRPIRPEPADLPQIKKAFRAAQRMRWLPGLAGLVFAAPSCAIGSRTNWQIGLGFFLIMEASVTVAGYQTARCPKCGQVWGIGALWCVGSSGRANELGTFVCRKCRLDIGLGLRD
jgi:hypothetical protein